jgi:hypothetical protein
MLIFPFWCHVLMSKYCPQRFVDYRSV